MIKEKKCLCAKCSGEYKACKTCDSDISARPGNALFCFKCIEKRNAEKAKESYKRKRGEFVGNKECLFCKTTKELQGHHSDMNRENNNSDNFIYLCRSCHSKVHFRILRPFVRNITKSLKELRFGVIEIAKIIGLSRQRIYKILERVDKE